MCTLVAAVAVTATATVREKCELAFVYPCCCCGYAREPVTVTRWDRPWGPKERRANLEWILSEASRLQTVAASGKKEYFLRSLYVPHKGAFLELPPKAQIGAGTGVCVACRETAEEEAQSAFLPLDGLDRGKGFRHEGHEYREGDFVFVDPTVVRGAEAGAGVTARETFKGGRNKGLKAWAVAQIVGFKYGAVASKGRNGGAKAPGSSEGVPTSISVRLFVRPEELTSDDNPLAYRAHVQEVRFRVQGLGFWVQGFGFQAYGLVQTRSDTVCWTSCIPVLRMSVGSLAHLGRQPGRAKSVASLYYSNSMACVFWFFPLPTPRLPCAAVLQRGDRHRGCTGRGGQMHGAAPGSPSPRPLPGPPGLEGGRGCTWAWGQEWQAPHGLLLRPHRHQGRGDSIGESGCTQAFSLSSPLAAASLSRPPLHLYVSPPNSRPCLGLHFHLYVSPPNLRPCLVPHFTSLSPPTLHLYVSPPHIFGESPLHLGSVCLFVFSFLPTSAWGRLAPRTLHPHPHP